MPRCSPSLQQPAETPQEYERVPPEIPTPACARECAATPESAAKVEKAVAASASAPPVAQSGPEKTLVREHLKPLRHPRRIFAALLHCPQLILAERATPHPRPENISRRNRVLNRQINPDPSHRRHSMRGISQAQEATPRPPPQVIDAHRQQLDIVPISQFLHASAQKRSDPRNVFAKRRQSLLPYDFELPLRDHIRALPIIAVVQHHQNLTAAESPQGLLRIARLAAKPHPKHVDGRTQIDHFQPSLLPHYRMPPVRPQSQLGTDFQAARRGLRANPHNAPVLFNQVSDLRLHPQMKLRIGLGLLRDKIQKVPLRHQCDELAMRWQMRKVRDRHADVLDLSAELPHFLMRPPQQLFQNSQLVHQFQGRRMNRVTAKVAQKIRMFFQYHHIHARARQQETRNHSRRSSARHAAASLHLFHRASSFFHFEGPRYDQRYDCRKRPQTRPRSPATLPVSWSILHSPTADWLAPSTPSSPAPRRTRSSSSCPPDIAPPASDSPPSTHRQVFPAPTCPATARDVPPLHKRQGSPDCVRSTDHKDP